MSIDYLLVKGQKLESTINNNSSVIEIFNISAYGTLNKKNILFINKNKNVFILQGVKESIGAKNRNNIIKLGYKIYNTNKTFFFGPKFIDNNNNKCRIIYKNKRYKITKKKIKLPK